MTSGDKLFGRLLGRSSAPALDTPGTPMQGLHLQLDAQGHVLGISGTLRSLLAPHDPRPLLRDLLCASSALSIEGHPADWQRQSLDLDFQGSAGQILHTRGWIEPQGDGWSLHLQDVSDLLAGRQLAQHREQNHQLACQMSEQLRACSLARLPEVFNEHLRSLAQRWRIPCVAMALLDEENQGWRIYNSYAAHDAPALWQTGQSLGTSLDSANGNMPLSLAQGRGDNPRLQGIFGNADGFLVPYRDSQGVAAWLLCGFYSGQQHTSDRDWLNLTAALAAPLLSRLREQRYHQQLDRMEALQGLLGTGWWELLPATQEIQLAPQLLHSLSPEDGPTRQPQSQWLELIHPADRQALNSRLNDLQALGKPLLTSVRLQRTDAEQNPLWYRVQGQVLGVGDNRRWIGFMLDISDIKNQQLQAAAAHARLDNLIASSPAVIYVQRYVSGALLPAFFSDSLLPLLGWTLADCNPDSLASLIHPEDRELYFERSRQLLREGSVRSRYRLRDKQGHYHWLLDEAKLLRDDLGLPVEAVGLWLDVTEATLAAEQIKQSEERYRILVEDSPAMICRYRPDLTLTFGNTPLANYLECPPAQLPGLNLGHWLSDEQRQAFVQRIARLSPEFPVSTAEISLQLPGREHAWWVWSDRGVFDEQGTLVEVQAVGRDNTEVRRSQQQLTQSAKMATLGEMATGLAHEINQPLNVMRMAIVNVLKRLSNGDAQVDYLTEKLQRIDTQVQRAARVVDHMRVFGRRSEIEQQPFDPSQAVEGTLSLLGEGLRGKGVDLRITPADFTVQVKGHIDQLEQVLINLMVNARDALLSKREKAPEFRPWIAVHCEHDSGHVQIWVEDNGGGIDPRLLERIFEPFFTTKPIGVGTGLGLSVSYGIVENMGGRLSVANGEHGARFCVELPVSQITR
ncbi:MULTISPECIES: PAS domain-containing sensor histidine kinase [Pseudomonas]|uniref:histidine kinase n=1 Tax=Pseudomonas fluorescens LMG 5329 TaxID=1324332 RepID=A0A0A1Z7G5_PSEFL|nr:MULTISPECIES: PAS domain-containing sensor histidine kinase [Pseudomonas]KGE68961.1 histidine kinase [Pseudomonas fluorescens LMG 5329]NWE01811.1 PAS domain-containing protein [Pseudomonas sp. IPO3749]NWF23964.1 PAS domain-containing protein [Pseudomonas sp. IPO3749]